MGNSLLNLMKIKPGFRAFILIVSFLGFSVTFQPAGAQEGPSNPETVILKYKPVLAPNSFKALLRLELERPGRPVRKYKISLWQKDPEQVRVSFEAPATEKGKILFRKKAGNFLFLPDLEESVSLPPSQMSGWSFFYAENLFPFYFQKDLVWKTAPDPEGRACASKPRVPTPPGATSRLLHAPQRSSVSMPS